MRNGHSHHHPTIPVLFLIVLLILSTCLTPAAMARSSDPWVAAFFHRGLSQPGSITCTAPRCQVELAGSIPGTLMLDCITYRRIDLSHGIRVYAGWPHDAQGRISGVQNSSHDPALRRLYENKLGPTIIWAVTGCQKVCIRGIVLHATMRVYNARETIVVQQVDTPIVDGVQDNNACLGPSFCSTPDASGITYAGAIDQPGGCISAANDGYRDRTGREYIIQPGDQLELLFRHRVLILCDGDVIGIADWGFRLTATLGEAANRVFPLIQEDVQTDLVVRNDSHLFERVQFAQRLTAVRSLLKLP